MYICICVYIYIYIYIYTHNYINYYHTLSGLRSRSFLPTIPSAIHDGVRVSCVRERGSAPKRGLHSAIFLSHQVHLCSGSLMV